MHECVRHKHGVHVTFRAMSLLCSDGKDNDLILTESLCCNCISSILFTISWLTKQISYSLSRCLCASRDIKLVLVKFTVSHKIHGIQNLSMLEALAHLSVCWSTGKQVINTIGGWGLRWPLQGNLWWYFTFHCKSGAQCYWIWGRLNEKACLHLSMAALWGHFTIQYTWHTLIFLFPHRLNMKIPWMAQIMRSMK